MREQSKLPPLPPHWTGRKTSVNKSHRSRLQLRTRCEVPSGASLYPPKQSSSALFEYVIPHVRILLAESHVNFASHCALSVVRFLRQSRRAQQHLNLSSEWPPSVCFGGLGGQVPNYSCRGGRNTLVYVRSGTNATTKHRRTGG
ncbi:MAG: hypothetical protein ACTS4X_01810 [Candidatus Hodgkinia cicadicola]